MYPFFRSPNYRFFLLLIFIAAALIVALTRQNNKKSSSIATNTALAISQQLKPSVLILDISTPLFFQPGNSSRLVDVRKWITQLDNALTNDDIKGVLVRMNSPGGSIVASQELFAAMKRFRTSQKPLIVSIADICASGGYYISLPATQIIANRGSLIGSIGVRISNNNISELLKKVGIANREFKSVPFKDILSPTRKMTPQEETYIQSIVDAMHQQFLADVIEWRGDKSSPATLEKSANGLIYLSEQALTNGLIDSIGNFHDAKMAMATALDIPYDDLSFHAPSIFPWWQDALNLELSSLSNLRSLLHLYSTIKNSLALPATN